jgi:DNA-binding phage protein
MSVNVFLSYCREVLRKGQLTMPSFIELLEIYLENHPEWTEAGLARAAGMHNSSIRQMLKYRRNPRFDTMEKICAVLGFSLENFMTQGRGQELAEIHHLIALLTPEEQAMIKTAVAALVAQRRDPSPK